jgi:hypothetical protein
MNGCLSERRCDPFQTIRTVMKMVHAPEGIEATVTSVQRVLWEALNGVDGVIGDGRL